MSVSKNNDASVRADSAEWEPARAALQYLKSWIQKGKEKLS